MKTLKKLSQKHLDIAKLLARNVPAREIAVILNLNVKSVYQWTADKLMQEEVQRIKNNIALQIDSVLNEYGALGALVTLYNAQTDKTITKNQITASEKLLTFSKFNIQKIDANVNNNVINIIDDIPVDNNQEEDDKNEQC